MKRNVWAPLLLAALLLMGGCRGAAEPPAAEMPPVQETLLPAPLPGRWVCAGAEMPESLVRGLPAALFPEGGERLAAFCEMPAVCVDLELQLDADGSFSLRCSEESSREAFTAVRAALEAGVEDYLLDTLRRTYAGAGRATDEDYDRYRAADDTELLEAIMGMSLEEICESLELERRVEEYRQRELPQGTWTLQDGTLTLESAGESAAAVYDAAADSITLNGRNYTRG